jgi:uncharacterized membrane protein
MGEVSSFFGRFHPILVHFPIGILWLAFVFELLSRTKKFKKVKFAVEPSLLIGAGGAVFAALSGFLLSQEGGYEEKLLQNHQWLGIGTAIFSLLTYLFHRRTFLLKEKQRKRLRIIVFIPLMVLLIATGHLGGSMTHGEDFLTPNSAEGEELTKQVSFSKDSNFYKHIIAPLLEKKCYSCHNAKKQKGQLRLDEVEFILKGGKHGVVVKPANATESELYKRLILPAEDEHHMPPKGRPQLTNNEVDVLYGWMEAGASFDKKISEFVDKKIVQYIESLEETSATVELDDTAIPELDAERIVELRAKGIIVMPLSQNTKFAKAFFINPATITDKEVELLTPFKQQLIQLKLTRTAISNSALKTLSTFGNLRSLELDYTAITDEAINQLKELNKLERLNLVSTKVTDKGILALAALPSLKEVFIFNTRVTKQAIVDFQKRNQKVFLDTGNYTLKTLASDTIVHTRKSK